LRESVRSRLKQRIGPLSAQILCGEVSQVFGMRERSLDSREAALASIPAEYNGFEYKPVSFDARGHADRRMTPRPQFRQQTTLGDHRAECELHP
jgi:hypothetical protein